MMSFALLAAAGLPGSAGFVAELYVLLVFDLLIQRVRSQGASLVMVTHVFWMA